MALGGGKYDEEAVQAFESTQAEHLVLIVVGGKKGNGFECRSTDPLFSMLLPELLHECANKIEEDLSKIHPIDKSVNSE